jgi:hypothetical protein
VKKVLIIIGIVFVGFLLLVVVGSVIEDKLKQPVVFITVAPTPTSSGTVTPLQEVLSYDEQRTFDFIDRKFVLLREINQNLMSVLDKNNQNDLACITAIADAAKSLLPIKKAWNRLDWAYGVVSILEDDFNRYMNATTRYVRAWSKGVLGGNLQQAARDAYYSRQRIKRFGPRVEQRLDVIRVEYQGH